MDHNRCKMGMCWQKIAAGLALFALGFAVADRFQLINFVLYRLAAGDPVTALWQITDLAGQAAALLLAILLLPRWWFAAAMVLAGCSILVNLGFGQTVGEVLDPGRLDWLLTEVRQAGNAVGEFAVPLIFAGVQTLAALALFVAARRMLRGSGGWTGGKNLAQFGLPGGLAAFVLPNLVADPLEIYPLAAERNVFGFAVQLALAAPPPPRARVTLIPDIADTPRHIVWLVDESVAYTPFQKLIRPGLERFRPLDFGPVAAMGHCSAPANVALRSGVDVRAAGPGMDLRATASIWAYARKAGYRTMLIDGQTHGAPQNLLLDPERALIDDLRGADAGMETDREIATLLNRQLKSTQRSFTYVVLRGVHFQYSDHYPAGSLPSDASQAAEYASALSYSKTGFFDRLFAGVDRAQVAVAYLSDHGQNFAQGALPHCSRNPGADEFRIPLLLFLPDDLAAHYADAPREGHSASQLFPASLIWMGYYSGAVEEQYDRDLDAPSARYVWFDRVVVPVNPGDAVEVTAGPDFPGMDRR